MQKCNIRRSLLQGGAALAAILLGTAVQAGPVKGHGSFRIDGRSADFDVHGCVVVEIPGKGAKLQMVGGHGKLQVSVNSNDLTEKYRRVQQASISFDPSKSSYTADYYLTDDGWQRRGEESVDGPLVHFSEGHLTVDGAFEQIGVSGPTPPVHGHIETECPSLTAARVAKLNDTSQPEAVGEARGSGSIDGHTASFKPDLCAMMNLGNKGHILNVRGEGDTLDAGAQDMRTGPGQTTQSVRLAFKDGTGMWNARRSQKKGQWTDPDGNPAGGPLIEINGTHIEADGEFALAGSKTKRAHGHFEADCPSMANLSGN